MKFQFGSVLVILMANIIGTSMSSFRTAKKNTNEEKIQLLSRRASDIIRNGHAGHESELIQRETREQPVVIAVPPVMPPTDVKAFVLSSSSILVMWFDPSLGKDQRITGKFFCNIYIVIFVHVYMVYITCVPSEAFSSFKDMSL